MTMTTVVTSITSQPPQVLWRSWCSCGLPKVRRVWARGGEAGPASCGTGFSHVIVTLCWCVSSSPHICRLMKRSLLCFYQLRLPRNGQNLSEIFNLRLPLSRFFGEHPFCYCCWCFSFIIFTTSQIPRLPWQWVGLIYHLLLWILEPLANCGSFPERNIVIQYNQCFMYFVFTCIVLYCIVYLIQICSHLGRRKLSTSLLAKTSTVGSATTSIRIKCLIWSSLKIHLESPKSANRELFVKVASFGKLPVIKWYDDD